MAMVGARPGQTVLMMGAADPGLAAAVAVVTGLNGRTVVADPSSEAEETVLAAAASEGTLVEFETGTLTRLPFDPGAFDIAVICQSLPRSDEQPARMITEAARLVREGGRIVVIEGARPQRVLGMSRAPARPSLSGITISDWLTAAGLRAARVLAESDGLTYVEASKR
jgi:ArsR family transcriptional regulator